MGLSRQEVNLRRLLAKCELMCKNQKEDDRFEKYIETLEDMLQEVKKLSDSSEAIMNYQRRIAAIKVALGITFNKYEDENDPESMRNNLLGPRHRNVTKGGGDNVDEIINYHENLQQKITEDMLALTKNLREQSETANQIIKKDTEVVTRSSQLTEQNYSKLTIESSKLAEHSKRAWKCWLWIMLAVVFIVFINMVLFMKVMKKKY
ncbi:vesicle transport protein USE1 [Anoplophora glabripennis]|uniref:vesicle transport protein USE1 n=1 Tax=Anoplophora glabripennis TaxID=217634 RepID=UPI0008737518|nr:vesicle transport protein USE1 [Anoplophora glabripennis]XP_018567974.1 vesicle transport protein USE1 [Anoplophora glabripennis]